MHFLEVRRSWEPDTRISTGILSLFRLFLKVCCGDAPSFSWKETGFVFQSPKVPSKNDSHFMKSCSNFFCWSTYRCLQLSLTTDRRSALVYLPSRIQIAHLVASCVLCGSMARLWLCRSAQSMLAPCSLLMSLIGKMILSMVIILYLKFKIIPNSFMDSCHIWPHQVLHGTFCYQNIQRNSAQPGLYAVCGRSYSKYSTTRVVYRFGIGSLASIGIDIPYTGTGRLVFWSVFWALENLAGTL